MKQLTNKLKGLILSLLLLNSVAWAGWLHDAARTNNVNDSKELLNFLVYLENLLEDESPIKVSDAVQKNNVDIVKNLLEHLDVDAPIDEQDGHGCTPLYFAAKAGNYEMVELLLNHGASVYLRNQSGNIPLHTAVINGHLRIVKLLLEKGASLVDVQTFGNRISPLHFAAMQGHRDIARLLLNNNANINIQDVARRTPLHYAVGYAELETVRVLLQYGANIHVEDEDGRTPLSMAQGDMRRLLLAHANGHLNNNNEIVSDQIIILDQNEESNNNNIVPGEITILDSDEEIDISALNTPYISDDSDEEISNNNNIAIVDLYNVESLDGLGEGGWVKLFCAGILSYLN